MKRMIACVLVLFSLVLCLTACSNETKLDASLVEFPGLKWGMTPEEVKEALDITDDQLISEFKQGEIIQISVNNLTLFGYPLNSALFYFLPSENGVYGLGNIEAYFTEDTDMAKVRDTMVGIYGDGDIWTGANHQINAEGELETIYGAKDPTIFQHYWKASSKIKDVIPAKSMEAVTEFFASVNPKATRDTVEEWVELANIGLIHLTDSSVNKGHTGDSTIYTNKCVTFGGDFILALLQKFGK